MAKLTQIEKAIANLDVQIATLQLARQHLVAQQQQQKPKKPSRPRDAKVRRPEVPEIARVTPALPPRYAGTTIADPPTFTGRGGTAWRLRLAPLGDRARPDWDATVDAFILRVPEAHPFWDHWLVSLIHLRPIAGVKPATIRLTGATHELLIMALDPECALPGLDVDASFHPRWLSPIDVVEQFQATDDAVAAQIFELAVRVIVDGQASPDQDWRAWWKEAVATTARHYADGTHRVSRS